MSTCEPSRKGAAVVEMAICLPFIFLLIISAVELSAGLFQQHTVRLTAHQCAITAADGGATCDDVQALANSVLSQRGYTSFTITIDEVTRTKNTSSVQPNSFPHFTISHTGPAPTGLDQVPRGTILKLSITAPRPQIAGLGLSLNFMQPNVVADCVFVKEH